MRSLKDELKGLDLEALKKRVSLLTSTHNEESPNRITYSCTKCKDEEGYLVKIPIGPGQFEYKEVWRDCDCKNKRRIERLMRSSKITESFRDKTFVNFETKGRPDIVVEAFRTAQRYMQRFPEIKSTRKNSIALLGRPGCGKTHLLMGVSNHLLIQGIGVVYFPWVEGFNEIKANLDSLEQRISQLQRAEVLFIDDLFKGRKEPTEFQIEQLFAIINYRYLENLPILISSEKSMSKICEYDEGIGSRINEMCRDYKVVLTGGIELNYRLL